jgi:hypothetical protein
MAEFVFDHIHPIHEIEKLNKGVFLWIWNANSIPAHVGISVDGSYFSLKANKKEEHVNVKYCLDVVLSKSLQMVFVKLSDAVGISIDMVQNEFDNYKFIASDGVTCLTPICRITNVPNHVKMLSELLFYLAKTSIVEAYFGANLTSDYSALPVYEMSDIQNHILNLKNVRR